jgi:hypothetical protein
MKTQKGRIGPFLFFLEEYMDMILVLISDFWSISEYKILFIMSGEEKRLGTFIKVFPENGIFASADIEYADLHF